MRLFESDNIWKRRTRAQNRAARPDTLENRLADQRSKLISDALWLFAAAALAVLGLLGLRLGVVPAEPVTIGFIVILALYVVVSLPGVSKQYKDYKNARK